MKTRLDYGTTGLEIDLAGVNASVLRPRELPGLADEAAGFREAARAPIGRPPLRDLIKAGERLAIVIPDITRPLPNEKLLNWVFAELPHVRAGDVVILSGTGSHRANTPAEWERMVGRRIYRDYRCVDHDAHDPATLAKAGTSAFGYPVYLNREYVEADRRIIMGFIEPHFMAGFSGGFKAVFPGVAGIDSIMHYHGADVIGDPRSTWGRLEDNPTQLHVRAGGAIVPVDFCINVTLNADRAITRFFCGDTGPAHTAGCAFVKETAMAGCRHDFPVVITTNSGYPLDQNLYQSVKGMSAAAQVLRPGGLILMAARCNDGFPDHGNFKDFLFRHASAGDMLEAILSPGFRLFDQWQVQVFAQILQRGRVALFSELDPDDVRRAHIEPVPDLRAALDAELARIGRDAPVAVLPEGPLTIPYLR
jgi:lactate racemase